MEIAQGSELRVDSTVEDPLKSLDELFEYDRPFIAGSVEDFHSVLSSINLSGNVPVDVRQLFETAKNVALYSRFAYRFHQVAETVSFSALEFGAKVICENDSNLKKVPLGLTKLLKHTKELGLFDNDFFDDSLVMATKNGIQYEREIQAQKEMKTHGTLISDPCREVTDQEIADGIQRGLAVDGHIKLIASLRNGLAHGSKRLSPTSFSVLRRNADLINYLFRDAVNNVQLDVCQVGVV